MSRADRICRRIIQLMAIAALLLLGYVIIGRFEELRQHFSRMAAVYLLPIGSLALLTTVIGWSRRPIHALALTVLLSLLLPIYAFEGWLIVQYEQTEAKVMQAAQRLGYPYDGRTVTEVVTAERQRLASDRVHSFFRLVTALEHEQLMLLGNTPRHRIVYCNEIGPYMIFDADRHGFNNPDLLWQQQRPDLMLIGDSYTQGACIPDGKDLASSIRQAIPGTLNLGMGGNDPFLNLATLVEYAVPMRPRRVLWFHFAGNDLSGMMGNRNHPILQRYVNDGHFSQQLLQRSDEIEQRMVRFYREQIATQPVEPRRPLYQRVLTRGHLDHWWRLYFLRNRLGLVHWSGETIDFDLFRRIMQRARDVAVENHIELTIVNVPHVYQIGKPADGAQQQVQSIVQSLSLPWYDLLLPFATVTNPASLYAFQYSGGHFSPAGNQQAAQAVLHHLSSGGPP
ncbi:MAG: hypothetical protein HQL58_03965 [Magnetococcales bacterium]|nr:hypothetical protein [Magnetococcales bacterium]